MSGKKLCPECGASKRVVKEHEWLSDGTIVQKKNPDHRMAFIETKNIASSFENVEEIIDMSIERVIVESKRRATFDFMDHMLPGIVKKIVHMVGVKKVVRDISNLGKVMGYGDIQLVRIRREHDEGDFATMSIKEPYSLPLFCGDICGTLGAIDRREVDISYMEKGTDEYEITAHISKSPLELEERLQTQPYTHKPGNISHQKCPVCGGPKALSEFRWHMDRGVIEDKANKRRMALVGPAALDAIIDELVTELGDSIPAAIIEAQRRFIKTAFYSLEEVGSEELFRKQLAIRGLGNLKQIEWHEDRMRFKLENPCLHLVIVGLVQGFFELAAGSDGEVEYELREDGDLVIDVELKI